MFKKYQNHIMHRLDSKTMDKEEAEEVKHQFVDLIFEKAWNPKLIKITSDITEAVMFKMGAVNPDWSGIKNFDGLA